MKIEFRSYKFDNENDPVAVPDEKSAAGAGYSGVDVWTPNENAAQRLRRAFNPQVTFQRTAIAERVTSVEPGAEEDARAPRYFRTYEQVRQAMLDLAKKYPDLVEFEVLGPSGEKVRGEADRDINMIRLTSKKSTKDKAGVLILTGEHAREIANPEMVMKWATELLEGYGKNPDITALLDSRVIDLVPMANPDGHAMVERAYAGQEPANLMQRKNTTAPNGVDLNRNHAYRWGGPGASEDPWDETYRGSGPASEPEVQAVKKLFDTRRHNIYISVHSHGEVNMFPWSHTREKAPDHEGLLRIAKQFSAKNGYSPIQAVDLYPTSGAGREYFYSLDRKPGFTIETGRTFHQSDTEYARVCNENIPVFYYAAKIADAPYEKSRGPEASNLVVVGSELQAHVKHLLGAGISAAEYVVDPDTAPGHGVPLVAKDGAFDTQEEAVTAKISDDLRDGKTRLIYVRAQDAEGNWGPLTAVWVEAAADTKQAA